MIPIDGEPWFVASDVTKILGYASGPNAVAKHVSDSQKGVTELMTPGGRQPCTVISEGGLYALVLGSKLESAKRFKLWVTDEVLPALRKDGMYVVGEEKVRTGELSSRRTATEDELVFKAVAILQKKVERLQEEKEVCGSEADAEDRKSDVAGLRR